MFQNASASFRWHHRLFSIQRLNHKFIYSLGKEFIQKQIQIKLNRVLLLNISTLMLEIVYNMTTQFFENIWTTVCPFKGISLDKHSSAALPVQPLHPIPRRTAYSHFSERTLHPSKTDWLLNFCCCWLAQWYFVPSSTGLMTIFYSLFKDWVWDLCYDRRWVG
jgi:hypothetical protein